MGSEQNDNVSFSPSEPTLCANGCGFFGTTANMNLCSKCYRDLRITEEQAASAIVAMEKSFNPQPEIIKEQRETEMSVETCDKSSSDIELPLALGESSITEGKSTASDQGEPCHGPTRCLNCNKKVGLTGFKCRCGSTFCGDHRYPEKHECNFDFKGSGRDAIAKANPIVRADKVERI